MAARREGLELEALGAVEGCSESAIDFNVCERPFSVCYSVCTVPVEDFQIDTVYILMLYS
jgi:hypothetical protein